MTSKMKGIVILLCVALALCCPPSSKADSTTYTYTGNSFVFFTGISCPPACSLDGSFKVSAPLAPNALIFEAPGTDPSFSFSFTDGQFTLSNANSSSYLFTLQTD